jgi:hypothetical protein
LADGIPRLARGKRQGTHYGETHGLLFRTASRHQSRTRKQIMNPETTHHHPEPWYRSREGVVIAMIAVVVLFFVIREHWEHLTGRWVYLLLLLCPLMHFFGHGGHGGHGKTGVSNGESS